MTYPRAESYLILYRPDDVSKHRDDLKWGYRLDDQTLVRAHCDTEADAQNAGDLYMREMTKWLAANDLSSINYWPTTPGVFQLDDVNTLLLRYRKVHGQAAPTRLTLGRFEDDQCAGWCWSTSYAREFYETHTRAEQDEIMRKNSDWYWSAEWRKGNRYLPRTRRPDLDIQIIDKKSWAEFA